MGLRGRAAGAGEASGAQMMATTTASGVVDGEVAFCRAYWRPAVCSSLHWCIEDHGVVNAGFRPGDLDPLCILRLWRPSAAFYDILAPAQAFVYWNPASLFHFRDF
jgi:hypothetical protein